MVLNGNAEVCLNCKRLPIEFLWIENVTLLQQIFILTPMNFFYSTRLKYNCILQSGKYSPNDSKWAMVVALTHQKRYLMKYNKLLHIFFLNCISIAVILWFLINGTYNKYLVGFAYNCAIKWSAYRKLSVVYLPWSSIAWHFNKTRLISITVRFWCSFTY